MTEQDKVTVDDIIGIVKTEEQTNSVEEVRKLRGRENKTAKRFNIEFDGHQYFLVIDEDNERCLARLDTRMDALAWLEMYKMLSEENEQLKTTIQQLRTDNTKQKKKLNTTMKENEQLKKEIEELKQALIRSAFDR